MTAHNTPQEALLQELSVTAEAGLSSQEAQRRLAEYGENKLAEKKKKTNFQRFLEQFQDVMILILLLAAVVSFVVACFGHDPMEFFEPVLILLIVVLNAVLGMVQESKAENVVKSLYAYFISHGEKLPTEYRAVWEKEGIHTAVCDYISGMSDRFAIHLYTELFVPKSWQGISE